MERRSLVVGVVIGAVAAGLGFAGVVNGQGKEAKPSAEVGRYQVSTAAVAAQSGLAYTVVTVIDTRTGECTVRRINLNEIRDGRPGSVSFDMK